MGFFSTFLVGRSALRLSFAMMIVEWHAEPWRRRAAGLSRLNKSPFHRFDKNTFFLTKDLSKFCSIHSAPLKRLPRIVALPSFASVALQAARTSWDLDMARYREN